MFFLKCTAKALKYLKARPADASELPEQTNRLGAWFANVITVARKKYLLLTNEKSLASVVLRAEGGRLDLAEFADRVRHGLEFCGVRADVIETEIGAMAEYAIARTDSRRVLGTMNDACNACRYAVEVYGKQDDITSPDWQDHLWSTPYGAIEYRFPRDEIARLLAERASGVSI